MRRLKLLLAPLLFTALALVAAQDAAAQGRAAAAGFHGDWNYAVYAADKSELPPAYRDMDLKEVPQYAIDVSIRQSGNRLRATCGVVAHYLARVDECDFTATVRNGTAQFSLKSNFGGSATVRLTLRGDTLRWKTVRRSGESYYPADIVLRRLKPGETPPYVEKDDAQ